MIRLLVDGIFFQLTDSGIARVWKSVLAHLVHDRRFEILFLDRGNAPRIDGIEYIPFPTYSIDPAANHPADSRLIQQVCDHYRIDAFTSTYYTTPLSTPMLLMVYDMIPELFGFDLSQRPWMEKQLAICYAQRYLAISHNTRRDLLALYPEISPAVASVAHCGVDDGTFKPRDAADVEAFREAHGLDRPYFLFVGSRVQHGGYKNSRLFFDALAGMADARFDIFCVGGEPEIEQDILDRLPAGVRCRRVSLSDEELALAYGGALSLVYPSLYEGFGMPVIEAMACGCPVITTRHGSLAEAAGDAALLVGGDSVDEMRHALARMLEPGVRGTLRERGLDHARGFRWEQMATRLAADLVQLVAEARGGAYDDFFREWSRLRSIQANVDFAR